MNDKKRQEEALFEAARNLKEPAQRKSFLDRACSGDPALRQRVEGLLAVDEQAEQFFDTGSLVASPPDAENRPEAAASDPTIRVSLLEEEQAGTVIGRYKLLERIGEGGCGVVYVAEQQKPVRRRVALKVIKLGMDTKQVVARFEAERQALALMDHPNIAKVLDAGATDSGRPYFVMELVRGIKITEYCDQNKLSTEDRLDLFVKVCRAIQHAHQKGIIHRDIKPSNILVTLHDPDRSGVPKVIDFGIAKATVGRLTEATVYTELNQFIGTPAYMSPEQAEMSPDLSGDVDTRSDIYSLGVLLYELLTGRTPFEGKELMSLGIDAMRRAIREKEPARPSTRLSTLVGEELTTAARCRSVEPSRLASLLRGDLDWIVMKCLEKDRTRRYETANGLAMDIQRHLDDEPVVARPPSKLYEFRKTVRRHKVGFAATAAVIVVLVCGVALTTWQAVRATRAERKAQTEAARSAQVAQFMKDMLKGVGPSVAMGRNTELLREILEQTAERLEELKNEPEVEADLLETLGVVYRDLSDYPRAEAMLRQALELRRLLHSGDHPDVARSIHNLATVYYFQLRNPEARASFEEALAMRRRLFGDENVEVAASLYGLAEVLRRDSATYPQAEAAHQKALRIRRELLGNVNVDVARSLTGLGILLRNVPGRLEDSERYLREALKIQRRLWGEEHPDIAYTLQNLGYTVGKSPGRQAEAEELLRETVAMQKKLLGDHRATAMSIQFLATIVTNRSEAIQFHREALEMRRKVLGDHPDTTKSVTQLVDALRAQGELAAAADVLHEQIAWLSGQSSEDSAALNDLRIQLATIHVERGEVEGIDGILSSIGERPSEESAKAMSRVAYQLRSAGKKDASEAAYRLALGLQTKLHGSKSTEAASAMANLSMQLIDTGKFEEAEQLARKALAIQDRMHGRTNHMVSLALFRLGAAQLCQGEFDGAEDAFREAIEIDTELKRTGRQESGQAFWIHLNLGSMYYNQERYPEAERVMREAVAIRESGRDEANELSIRPVYGLAAALRAQEKYEQAEAVYRHELSRRAELPNRQAQIDGLDNHAVLLRFRLGQLLRMQGKEADMSDLYEKAYQHGAPWLLNELAWSLATSAEPALRDGPTAVKLGQKLVAKTGRTDVMYVDTLAAAYAEIKDFTNAVRIQLEAVALLPADDDSVPDGIKSHLALYQTGRPYHETGELASKALALLKAGKFTEAEPIARECLELREVMIPDDWLTFNSKSMLGGAYLGQENYVQAEPLLIEGYNGLKEREDRIPSIGKLRLPEAAERLVRLYEATGQTVKAAEWKQKLDALNPPASK